ncbi:MAG: ribonuclease H-like domain-containing protein [Armatimonadetes bacterium]|nr:ribonuclease H-like domain-containing protein [Armatimonadota bacterium]
MNDWIYASELYNWTNGDQLLDWLDMFGLESGYAKDEEDENYIEEADLSVFTRSKGNEFEDRVLDLIRDRFDVQVVDGARGNHDSVYEQTTRLIQQGQEIIYQGLVRDDERRVFGVPDLIVRGDAMDQLVPGSLDGDADTYYVVDIKYKGLGLNKKGDLSSKHNWEKVQLALYEGALAKMLNRDLARSYILGRSAGNGSVSCFDALGWAKPGDPRTLVNVEEGLQWIRDLREHGKDWTLDPPSDPRLAPNTKSKNSGDWKGVFEALTASEDREVDEVPPVSPAHISANRADWIENLGIEFYVDFETLNSLNDDFTKLPNMNGKPMIFMIGCGHEENSDFVFKVWTMEEETYEEEKRIIEEWLAYMEETRKRLASNIEQPHIFHWFRHEPGELGKAADRHDQPQWKDVPWYDLLKKLMKEEPVMVRGTQGHSLKPITRSMESMGLIETVWAESQVSGGTEAMTAAWWCYEQVMKTGVPVREAALDGRDPLMPEVESYNEVDCKAMWEILHYLRSNH